MEKLPDDILNDILLRLPTKPIGRSRCVSKKWNSLSSNPSFIKSHLNRSIQNNNQRLFIIYGDMVTEKAVYTVRSAKYPKVKLRNFHNPPFNPTSNPNCERLIGYVDGLLCLSSWSYDFIHIWNPCINALLTLPPSSQQHSNKSHRRIDAFLGFGFDPKTNDYKVVKFLMLPDEPIDEPEEWLRPVEVYSMRNNSWEFIPQRFPPVFRNVSDTKNDVVCVDGRVHWLCFRYSKETILVFDFGMETFSEIAVPMNTRCLGLLAGKISVFSYKGWTWSHCEVWVMEEYGVAESWVKHHVVSLCSEMIHKPLGFSWRNEILFETMSGRLALYDPNTTEVKKFGIFMGIYGCRVALYVDSLVWIAPS